MVISNIAELVQNTDQWIGFLLICLIILIICFIVIKIGVENDNALIQIIFGIVFAFSFFGYFISLVICSFSDDDYYIELDERINTIVEENISTEAKKEKIITYLETEKFFGNIIRYENLDNNFKVDYIYNFEITDSNRTSCPKASY